VHCSRSAGWGKFDLRKIVRRREFDLSGGAQAIDAFGVVVISMRKQECQSAEVGIVLTFEVTAGELLQSVEANVVCANGGLEWSGSRSRRGCPPPVRMCLVIDGFISVGWVG
jgi:hypothetical protein